MFFNEITRMITDWEIVGEKFSAYGWYHLMWLAIMIVTTLTLCLTLARRHNSKTDDNVMFFFGAMLLLIEVYKQFFYLVMKEWRYDFSHLPLQFCDVPSWVMFIIPFLKEGKVKDACYKFLAFFGLLAGTVVMLYPGDVFNTTYITILIHTMLWHASMVVAGVYVVVAKGYGVSFKKEYFPGLCVYSFFLALAVTLNETVGKLADKSFNLFYINSRAGSHLPVFSSIYSGSQGTLRWVLLVALYLFAFALGGSIIFLIIKGVRLAVKKTTQSVPAHK